jgi:hypothetical protein
MTKKIMKTAMGKTIDMGALILQNETVRAVGNMGVNARGDILDSADRVIEGKNKQVQRQYSSQSKTNVQDLPVHRSSRAAQTATKSTAKVVDEQTFLNALNEPPNKIVETPPAIDPAAGGLAGALARANKQKDSNND